MKSLHKKNMRRLVAGLGLKCYETKTGYLIPIAQKDDITQSLIFDYAPDGRLVSYNVIASKLDNDKGLVKIENEQMKPEDPEPAKTEPKVEGIPPSADTMAGGI